MKPRTLTTFLATAGVTIGLLVAPVMIGPQGITDQNAFAAKKKVRSTPIYKPPKRGAPGGRVGGGTRGPGDALPALVALAPNHVGLTAQEQPSLYWYISKVTDHPLELTIVEPQAVDPVLETALSQPTHHGVQRVRLADYGVRLALDKEYQWFVALISDREHRSKDRLAGGRIERMHVPQSLVAQLAQADQVEAANIYAQAGFWYEAIAAVSEVIDAASADSELRELRATLLDQVGLREVAAADRGGSGTP